MNMLTPEACDVLTAGRLVHLVAINADGSPHVSIVWVGLDGDRAASRSNAAVRYVGRGHLG